MDEKKAGFVYVKGDCDKGLIRGEAGELFVAFCSFVALDSAGSKVGGAPRGVRIMGH